MGFFKKKPNVEQLKNQGDVQGLIEVLLFAKEAKDSRAAAHALASLVFISNKVENAGARANLAIAIGNTLLASGRKTDYAENVLDSFGTSFSNLLAGISYNLRYVLEADQSIFNRGAEMLLGLYNYDESFRALLQKEAIRGKLIDPVFLRRIYPDILTIDNVAEYARRLWQEHNRGVAKFRPDLPESERGVAFHMVYVIFDFVVANIDDITEEVRQAIKAGVTDRQLIGSLTLISTSDLFVNHYLKDNGIAPTPRLAAFFDA